MRNMLLAGTILAFTIAGAAIAQDGPGTFEQVKAKTFDKEKFIFPDDVRGTQLNIIFLSMGRDRESGEAQQLELLEWHDALAARGVFSDAVMPYHFAVLAGVPFFVKGMIGGEMRDTYDGKVLLDQAAILYIKDLDRFAAAAGLTADGQATIVIASADAKPLRVFKGKISEQGVNDIVAAIEQLK
jgi:hypothetical protein